MRPLPCLALTLLLTALLAAPPAVAGEKTPTLKQVIKSEQQKANPAAGETSPAKAKTKAQPDASSWQVQPSPRQALLEFVEAANRGDYQTAAHYLDLSHIPAGKRRELGPRLAYRLKVAGARTLLLDLDTISDSPRGDLKDGLPANLERIATIRTPEGSVKLYMRRSRQPNGEYLWRFSPRTVAQIDLLYKHFGHGVLGEKLTEYLPDFWFLGMQLWQWAAMALLVVFSYLAAWLLTALLEWLLARRRQGISNELRRFERGPLRLLIAAVIFAANVNIIGLSLTARAIIRGRFVLLLAMTWCVMRLVDVAAARLALHMQKVGNQQATVILRPIATIFKVLVAMTAGIVWLDNLGFKVTTILASLGVGGIAVALAAQDTLKGFLGSIAILLDKPYRVGERIVVQGHDGVVEDIGLRSTKIRQLDGHQTVIPNELVAKMDVENIGRRPYIRRLTNLGIAYDTPPEKAARAVEIIQEILAGHEGMRPELPPRVYLSEFNQFSLNILMLYWYHPADYWAYQSFNQRGNLEILKRFAAEGIRFAFPTSTSFLASDPHRPLKVEAVWPGDGPKDA